MADLISTASRFGYPSVELYYGGNRLYPAPLIDFARNITRNSVDVALSQEDTYTLKGLYYNPVSGYYQTVVTNMNVLKSIFSQDGQELVIRAGGGNPTLPSGTLIVSGIYPIVTRIAIPDRIDQFQRFDYEVELLSKTAVSGVSGVVNQSTDSWQVDEEVETGATKLTHRVSAVGVNTSTSGSPSNALTNARSFVASKVGTGNIPSGLPIFCSPPSGFGTNYRIYEFTRSRSESFDNETGSYEISEVFLLVSGTLPYSNNRTFEWSRDKDGIITVSIQGTVQGYGRTDGTKTAYNGFYQAQSGFLNNIYPSLGTDGSGIYTSYGGSGTLAVNNPQSYSLTENRFLGTIGYSISWTDDPAQNLPSGIAEQSLSIRRTEPVELVVSHTIPFRRLGNILQKIGTGTVGTIQISVNIKAISTGNAVADTNTAIAYAQDLINQNRPNPSDYVTLKLLPIEQDADKFNLSINATATWEFTTDLASVNTPEADILLRPVT